MNCVVRLVGLVLAFLLAVCEHSAAESKYHSYEALEAALTDLAESHPGLVKVRSLVESIEGRDVFLVEVGHVEETERDKRPAMLVVAGLEGHHLVGTEMALAFLEHLSGEYDGDDSIQRLLDTRTIYVVPRLNPDAAERFFKTPKLEQAANLRPTDDDHDSFVDEDDPDDLNGDGLITWVRIKDPEGTYIQDPKDDRLMIAAKSEKGQQGEWRYFVEGFDNDADEKFNEDGTGGVNFNMNFPYDYPFFTQAAGVHQVCEPATRALADFVIAHPNIGIVHSFSTADNLLKSPKEASEPAPRKPLTGPDPKDSPLYAQLAKEYREALGLSKELTGAKVPGSFPSWMYHHRGRLSLAARAWTPGMQLAIEKGAEEEEEESGESDEDGEEPEETSEPEEDENEAEADEDKEDADKSNGDDDEEDEKDAKKQRDFLEWIDENHPEGFVEWQPIEHPDFEGQRAEVGGFAPYVNVNPPAALLPDLGERHAEFLVSLAGKLPEIAFRKCEAKHLGEGLFEIEIEVENNGYLPTVLAHGERTRKVLPTRVELDLPDELILAGDNPARLGAIEGSGGMKETRYIIRRTDKHPTVTVYAVSALGSTVENTIALTQE